MTLTRRNVKAFDRSYRHEITRLWRLPIATLLEHERKMNAIPILAESLYRSNEIRIPIGRIRSLPTSFTPILIVQGTFVGRFVVRIRRIFAWKSLSEFDTRENVGGLTFGPSLSDRRSDFSRGESLWIFFLG